MSEKGRHVLLREDLEPALDEAEGLAAMADMADAAGGWRGHIPYTAARGYGDDAELRAQYELHVDGCKYCQRMVDALNPPKEVAQHFRELVHEMLAYEPVAEGIKGWVVQHVSATSLAGASYGAFLLDPGRLQALEAKKDVTSKFKAARIYLASPRQSLAYERIVEGCAMAKIDNEVIGCLTAAAQAASIYSTKSLEDSARELTGLLDRGSLNNGSDQLQLLGVLAQLGQHDMAMESLHSVLIHRDGTDEVVEALEVSELVGREGGSERWKSWLARGTASKKGAATA